MLSHYQAIKLYQLEGLVMGNCNYSKDDIPRIIEQLSEKYSQRSCPELTSEESHFVCEVMSKFLPLYARDKIPRTNSFRDIFSDLGSAIEPINKANFPPNIRKNCVDGLAKNIGITKEQAIEHYATRLNMDIDTFKRSMYPKNKKP